MSKLPRVHVLLAAALATGVPLYASAAPVDLDDPAVFEVIREGQPALALRIQKVLAAARFVPPGRFPELVAASFETATSASASYVIRTSYPGLIRVAFEVEGTKYRATVPFNPARSRLPPTGEQGL